MSTKRLLDSHPTKVKFEKLLSFLEENRLEIAIFANRFEIIDRDRNLHSNQHITVVDAESIDEEVSELPPTMEFKLILEDFG